MGTARAPVDPSGDEGRSLLRRELLHSEYHQQNLWQRLLAWLGRLFDRAVGTPSGVAWGTPFVPVRVGALLLAGLRVLLSRLRRDRRQRVRPAALLPDRRPA